LLRGWDKGGRRGFYLGIIGRARISLPIRPGGHHELRRVDVLQHRGVRMGYVVGYVYGVGYLTIA
jgi:hypothetical protein